jgi:hypothetical protein
MEKVPNICVAGMVGVVFGFAITVFRLRGMPCGVVLLVLAPFIWIRAGYRFGAACGFKRGWIGVLGWYHLAAIVGLAFSVLLVTVAAFIAHRVSWIVAFVGIGGLVVWSELARERGACGPDVCWMGVWDCAKRRLDACCREFAAQAVKREASADKCMP